jgi:hypothetical protein
LPAAMDRPLSIGPKLFVDPARGDDKNAGSIARANNQDLRRVDYGRDR